MRKIEKEEILIPLLEKIYKDEESFYNSFSDAIKKGGELSLSDPFGFSLIITNIIDRDYTVDLINSLKNNKYFIQTIDGMDEIDKGLFEENAIYSFKRHVFRCKENFIAGFRDKENKEVKFSLFISVAKTNLHYHIVSFVFTTWMDSKNSLDTPKSYVKLSNKQIIDLIGRESKELGKIKRDILVIEPNIENSLKINKNTFLAIEFWRKDWLSEEDNLLDVAKYIVTDPYYFYSLLTLDKNVFRRNFKNIMDILGWCFSSSRVQRGLISRNIHLAISLKPNDERFKANGHDGTEFRVWEILGLQNYLLNSVNVGYADYTLDPKSETAKEMLKKIDEYIKDLNNVYNFDLLFRKVRKGDLWIKLGKYVQGQMGIDSYYDIYLYKYKILL